MTQSQGDQTTAPGTALVVGSCTDKGRVRNANEDSHSTGDRLVIVADGLGGHNAGDVASRIAVKTAIGAVPPGLEDPAAFGRHLQEANRAVWEAAAADPSLTGMGTTITAALLVPGTETKVFVANVGDSRTYIYRDGDLIQVSVDHTVAQEMVDNGELTAEEAREHPRGHMMTRALGVEPHVKVDVFVVPVRTGDRVLLCSDGLTNEVNDEDIAEALWRHRDPQECARRLVALANDNGGHDNITAVVADVRVAAARD